MNSGRGVGFDIARSETPYAFTLATPIEFLNQPQLVLCCSSFFLLSSAAFFLLSCPCCCGRNVRSTLQRPRSRLSRHRQNDPVRAFGDRQRQLWDSVLCIKIHASTGHLVVHFVTCLIVGDRRFPGATIPGGESVYFFRQSLPAGPADRLRTSWCLVVWTVCEMSGPARSDGAVSWRMVFVRRCGVPVASCCGSGGPNVSRR